MSHSRRLIRRRPHLSMDNNNHPPARPKNRFWVGSCVLFVFWYFLLYGFDWSSLPAISPLQLNSLQSGSATLPEPDRKNQSSSNVDPVPESDDYPISNNSLHKSDTIDDVESEAVPKDEEEQIIIIQKERAGKSIRNNSQNKSETIDDLESEAVPKDEEEQIRIIQKEKAGKSIRNNSQHKSDTIDDLESEVVRKDEEQIRIIQKKERAGKSCAGRYIYIQDIPSRYNADYIKECKKLNKWHDMCQYFANDGLGQQLGNPQRLFLRSGWYVTHQFSLEVIFHNRMKQYDCLTNDSSRAAAVYVPYYAGLDVSRYLWDDDDVDNARKDADATDVFRLLKEKPEWGRMGGKDHFMVLGRITWDFRRVDNNSHWGSNLMVRQESQNMTMLTIESSPWDKNDFAIPYPTYFHPSSDRHINEWQEKMRRQRRRSLLCFAGAPRPGMQDSIRDEIMAQCTASKRCRMIECKDNKNNCLKPANVMKMFQNSVFCLQPPGDSFTRRSTFDSILAGCIPVFFSPGSAYVQYLWHLPRDFDSYSVLIPEGDVKQKTVSIDKVLSRISKTRVAAMRENVIRLIPNVVYGDTRSRLEKTEDAFELTIKGVIERVEMLKKEIREGRNNSSEFDGEKSWKYYTFGTTKPHEWDHYFVRHP